MYCERETKDSRSILRLIGELLSPVESAKSAIWDTFVDLGEAVRSGESGVGSASPDDDRAKEATTKEADVEIFIAVDDECVRGYDV